MKLKKHGVVINVLVSVPPPSHSVSKIYPKNIAMNEIKRHVKNLKVIVPSEEVFKYPFEIEKSGIGAECEDDK